MKATTVSKLPFVLSTLLTGGLSAQDLKIDFGNAASPVETGYQPYQATDRVPSSFTAQTYTAFGSSVTLTPLVTQTTEAGASRIIDRPGANDGNWRGDQVDLVTDWLGVDTRSGNGNYAIGNPIGDATPLELRLAGVPAGNYLFTSFHHDNENVFTSFLVEISNDGGTTFSSVMGTQDDGSFPGTNAARTNGRPFADQTYQGGLEIGASILPSTVYFNVTSLGSDLVIRYTPLSAEDVHTQILAINGFELLVDTDLDLLPDDYETANGFTNGTLEGSLNADIDTLTNFEEYRQGTDPNKEDTDDDDLNDDIESNTGIFVDATDTGTSPLAPDSDGDTINDNLENPLLDFVDVNQPGTDPNLFDTDGDFFSDSFEASTEGGDPTEPLIFPRDRNLLVDFNRIEVNDASMVRHYQQYQPFNIIFSNDQAGTLMLREFQAFDTTVGVKWDTPDTTGLALFPENRPARTYSGVDYDLVSDGLFLNSRSASNSNGTNAPTTITLTLSSLPAGTYRFQGFHHDLAGFVGTAELFATDADFAMRSIGTIQQTSSVANLGVAASNVAEGGSAVDLLSTADVELRSNGTDPVILIYQVTEPEGLATDTEDYVFTTLFLVNGFSLTQLTEGFLDGPEITSFTFEREAAGASVNLTFRGEVDANYGLFFLPTLNSPREDWVTVQDNITALAGDTPVSGAAAFPSKGFFIVVRN